MPKAAAGKEPDHGTEQSNSLGYIARIEEALSNLSSSEKRVGEYVLQKRSEILSMSVHELGKAAGISGATVVRFCRSLGYRGFAELKFYVERNLFSPAEGPVQIEAGDSITVIKNKVMALNRGVIDETLRSLDDEELERAVSLLSKARHIDIYAEGGSGSMGYCALNTFIHTGLFCNLCTDASTQVMSAAYLKSGDVAIGITHSGRIINTIDAMKIAKQRGAATICITGHKNSPITRWSDVVLNIGNMKSVELSDLPAARFGELCIISILQMGVLMRNYEKFSGVATKVKEAVKTKRTD